MDLSNDLISKFVKITNDEGEKKSKETVVYGTTVEYDGAMYVRIDGSDLITPVDTTADVKANERVTVMIKDHTATVTGNISDPSASSSRVKDLNSQIAEFDIVIATKVSTEFLEAEIAQIETLIAEKADIAELTAIKADIEDLTVNNAKIENLVATKADIIDLNATNANITNLNAEIADIQTLVNGNLTSDNIQSLNLTSANTTIQNALIKNAMIDSISANKIITGTIDTNSVSIQSEDGSMILTGSVQQFKDENGTVRIQIGKDGGGNFTFILYDESGKGVLIDESGLKSSDAIADGLIVDAKVAANANISGSKLDIASVVTEVNNGTTTIKSNKIYLDEKGQSLDVAFNKMQTTVDDNTEDIRTNTTTLTTQNGKISTLITENQLRQSEISDLNENLNTTTTSMNNKYTSLEQNLDGFKTTVGETYASKETVKNLDDNLKANYSTTSAMNSAIDQKANQITSTVSATYTTKSEFNNLNIGGSNHASLSNMKNYVGGNLRDFSNSPYFTVEGTKIVATNRIDKNYVPGFKVYTDGSTTFVVSGLTDLPRVYVYYTCFNSEGTVIKSQNVMEKSVYDGKFTVIIDDIPSTAHYFHIGIGDTTATNFYLDKFKIEKGNKATDWSPAPEDIQGQITDLNNNLVSNYSTTSAMNSAIDQKANQITSTVSETYTTKFEFGNMKIGGRNLFKDSKTPILGQSDHGNVSCSVVENDAVKMTPVANGNIFTTGLRTYVAREQGVEYTLSFDILTPNSIGFYWYPSEAYTKFSYIPASSEWQRVSFTYTQTGADASTNSSPLFGFHQLVAGQTYYYKHLQLEKGNKATDWSPAPEDLESDIIAVADNLTNNYSTTSAMNSAIDQKANQITSTVSSTYATKQSVTDLSNNLTNNYSTTSQMNSAIDQKANQITSTVSSTYATKQTVTNLSQNIIGVNLIPNSTGANSFGLWTNSAPDKFLAYYEGENQVGFKCLGTRDKYINCPIIQLEKGQTYTLSYMQKNEPAQGATDWVGLYYTNTSGAYTYITLANYDAHKYADFTKVFWTFIVPEDYSCDAHISFWAYNYDVSFIVKNIKLEKGTTPTAWTTAPGDDVYLTEAINDKLIVEYSTTTQMNSAIDQKANQITSTVSDTYTTKSEFANLEIGGSNHASLSNMKNYYGGELRDLNDPHYFTVEGTKIVATNRTNNSFVPGFKVYTDGSTTFVLSGLTDLPRVYVYYMCYNSEGTKITSQNYMEKSVNDGKLTVIIDNIPSTAHYFHIGIGDVASTNFYIDKFKIEKGNKATDWSPAPEDVQGQITDLSNNLAANYSTTSAMNSAIDQKANQITSTVSSTYATKQSVTDLNNNLTNNYSTTSAMNSAIDQKANQITQSVSETYTTIEEFNSLSIGGTNLLLDSEAIKHTNSDNGNGTNCAVVENGAVKLTPTNNGNIYVFMSTSEAREQGVEYTLSFDILTPNSIGFYWYPSEAYTKYNYIPASSKWQRVSFTYTQTGATTNGYPLFGLHQLVAGETYYYKHLQLEKGNKATDWAPSPKDTANSISSLSNRVLTAESTLSKDGLTTLIGDHYTTSSDVNGILSAKSYATTSQVQQTKNELTATFKSSGGYNLIKNGRAVMDTSFWKSNGGGISRGTNAGGEYIGTFFTTGLPSGITGTEWIELKSNTDYVYQAMLYSPDIDISNSSDGPLHMQTNSTQSSGHTQITVLDYNNAVPRNNWTQCYVHFRTAASGRVYFMPFIYLYNVTAPIYASEIMLSESTVPLPYSPHPTEIYDGITKIDKNGITVTQSNAKSKTSMSADGFAITRTDNGKDIFRVGSNGVLTLNGNFKCYRDGANQSGPRLESSGAIMYGYNDTGGSNPVFASGLWTDEDMGYFSVGYTRADVTDANGCLWLSPQNGNNGCRLTFSKLVSSEMKTTNLYFQKDGAIDFITNMRGQNGTDDNYTYRFDSGVSVQAFRCNNIRTHNIYPRTTGSHNIGSPSMRYKDAFFDSASTTNSEFRIGTVNTDGSWKTYGPLCVNSSSGYVFPSGNANLSLGMSSYRFHTLFCTNNPNVSSDKRMKTDIHYLGAPYTPEVINGRSKVNMDVTTGDMYDFVKDDLRLASYRYKVNIGKGDTSVDYGFIAQDILYTKVGSEIVQLEDPDNLDSNLSYNQGNYIATIAGALQEEIKIRDKQIAELEDKVIGRLQEEIKMKDAQISDLETRLAKLESIVEQLIEK